MKVATDSNDLVRKLDKKTAVICIIGLGQVGLPTALSFLKSGYKVSGYDVNEKLIRNLKGGLSPLPEQGFKDLINRFIKKSLFSLSFLPDVIASSDVIIVCVPTPLDNTSYSADMRFMKIAIESVARYLTTVKLIIIESTIPPGSMKNYIIPLIERLSNKKAYMDFLISFCPERFSPGTALQEFIENDRIIGANDEQSYLSTLSLFKKITKGKIHRTDTTTAEISKLAENSYRDINIAFANELAIICRESKVDVQDVIRLANTHPRVNIHKPGPGVGGPCLPKDPYLLVMRKNFEKSIVTTARRINDSMPFHIVDILVSTLRSKRKNKKHLNILVLGVSYKPDVNDTRYSPTQTVVLALKREGFRSIVLHDPYSNESFGARFSSQLSYVVGKADCVIISTGHSLYSTLSPSDFKKGCIIVDAVRVLRKEDFLVGRLTYIGL
jgi:UDP-N-acetyl-D-mannosaminuronic acid dehydrogenase